MTRDIRIDAPGAGEWVMQRVEGYFTPGLDHSFTRYRDEQIMGGIVLCQYLGNSMTAHMAGEDKYWCSRELLWMVFHYGFEQVGCTKMLGPVRSDNYRALEMDMRGGWELEAVIRDVYEPGVHMMVLSMTKDSCPWLKYQPRRVV